MAVRQLNGKRVFVTGAASGIGAATAVAFANEGCSLVIADKDVDGIASTASLVEAVGVGCEAIALDVTDENQFHEVAAAMAATGGVPQVVINNAGVGAHGSFLNTPMAAVRRLMEVNLYGVYNGCHAFLPLMLQSDEPCHLVNVASLASIAPMPNMSAYAVSKYAVDGLTEVLAMELAGTNVDVTCVHPGIINTPIVAGKSYNGDTGLRQEQRLAEYYRQKGSDPRVVAEGIVNAVKGGCAHLWVGSNATAIEKIKRISPVLMRRMAIQMAHRMGYA